VVDPRARLDGQAAVFLAAAGVLMLTMLVITFFPWFTDFIVSSGNSLYAYTGEDLLRDYTRGVAWALVLALALCLWPRLGGDRRALVVIWAAKCVAALGLGLIFERQYGLDGDGYFTNATMPSFVWEGFRLGHGTENIWQLTWLHLQLVPSSYHAAKVGFSMIGLLALYQFYKASEIILGRKDSRLLIALALYPSILFWSSTLGKDAPMLLGMALYARGAVSWALDRRANSLPLIFVGCAIVLLVRFWYFPMLLGPFMVLSFLNARRTSWRLPIGLLSAAALVVSIFYVTTFWEIRGVVDLIETRSAMTSAFVGGGSTLEAQEINSFGDLVRVGPVIMFTALFRPLPFEVPNMFGFVQGMENLFLLFLFVRAAWRTRFRDLFEPLVVWASMLVLTWAVVYGTVAYNLGTLARYKLQVLPVFLCLLLYLGRRRTRKPAVQEKEPCAA